MRLVTAKLTAGWICKHANQTFPNKNRTTRKKNVRRIKVKPRVNIVQFLESSDKGSIDTSQ